MPAVTAVLAREIVPEPVIVPPLRPVPAVMEVTVPVATQVPSLRKNVVVDPAGAEMA